MTMPNSTVTSKMDEVAYIPLVIIGAGESGIAMGCRLKQVLGFDQFRIFERQSGIGGTWWINTYPGISRPMNCAALLCLSHFYF
jgi:cation diffusion facilitator CzcD-associated flavoprotein CzcO